MKRIYFINVILNIIYIYCNVEIKQINFRESLVSIGVTKIPGGSNQLKCEAIIAKIEPDFTPNTLTEINMACLDNFARADINFEDYMSGNGMFTDMFNFKVTILHGPKNNQEKLIEYTCNDVQVQPGKIKKFTYSHNGIKIDVDVMYRCQGYDGYNCHLEPTDHPYYYRDPYSKKSICNAIDKDDCGDLRCPKENTINCNNGECYINTFDKNDKYCVCNSGYYGVSCENAIVGHGFREELLLFAPETEIIQPTSADISECPEDCKSCKKYGDLVVCEEMVNDGQKYECVDETCDETCGVKFCRMQKTEYSDVMYYVKKLSKRLGKEQI